MARVYVRSSLARIFRLLSKYINKCRDIRTPCTSFLQLRTRGSDIQTSSEPRKAVKMHALSPLRVEFPFMIDVAKAIRSAGSDLEAREEGRGLRPFRMREASNDRRDGMTSTLCASFLRSYFLFLLYICLLPMFLLIFR